MCLGLADRNHLDLRRPDTIGETLQILYGIAQRMTVRGVRVELDGVIAGGSGRDLNEMALADPPQKAVHWRYLTSAR